MSGVSYGSTGGLTADVIGIEGNLTININNPTKEVVAELLKIDPNDTTALNNKGAFH